ncbi:MAG TPA: hypothetical protein PK280_14515 [Planctomycetota bacterium]|nr:hypothetical protein [Planctomycetota bacterium]
MPSPLFEVHGNTLKLLRNPEITEIESVKQALCALVDESQEGGEGVLDMSVLSGASSTTVGMTVAVHLRFAEAGRRLRIKLNSSLLRLFELTMLTDTLSLELPGNEAAAADGRTGGN